MTNMSTVQREICLRLANGDRHMSTHVVEREHDGRRILFAMPMYLEREVDGVLYLFILATPASAPLPHYVEVERRGTKTVPEMHVRGETYAEERPLTDDINDASTNDIESAS